MIPADHQLAIADHRQSPIWNIIRKYSFPVPFYSADLLTVAYDQF